MIKILHTADHHINVGFKSKSKEVMKKLKNALLNSFESMTTYCITEKIDILLLAGDFFDNRDIGYKIEKLVVDKLTQLGERGIKIIYCAGNHDPLGSIGFASRLADIPNFKGFFAPGIQDHTVEVRGHKIRFVGNGYEGARTDAKISDYPPRSGKITVGISHLSVESGVATGHAVYNPTSKETLERLGYDYFALGHIHKRQMIGNTQRIAYSGSLQGLHINETGRHGGYLVGLSPSSNPAELAGISVSEVNFSNIIFEKLDLDISHIDQAFELESELKNLVNAYLEPHYIRLNLKGETDLDSAKALEVADNINLPDNIIQLEIKTDQIRPRIDIEHEKKQNSLVGFMLREIDRVDENNKFGKEIKTLSQKGVDLEAIKENLISRTLRIIGSGE